MRIGLMEIYMKGYPYKRNLPFKPNTQPQPYIKKDDVSKVENHHNTDKSNSNGVAVLNYHFFYLLP